MDAQAVSFGRALGQSARPYILANGRLKASITDYAAALLALAAPDRDDAAQPDEVYHQEIACRLTTVRSEEGR